MTRSFWKVLVWAVCLITVEAEISKWTQEKKVLVVTTQVAHEGSDMEVYAVGQTIKQKLSLIEAFDMTTEAIVTKLMWILGITRDPKEIAEIFYCEPAYISS